MASIPWLQEMSTGVERASIEVVVNTRSEAEMLYGPKDILLRVQRRGVRR